MLVRRSTAKVDQIDSWDGEFVIRREMKQTVLIFRRMRGNLTEMYTTLKGHNGADIVFSAVLSITEGHETKIRKKKISPSLWILWNSLSKGMRKPNYQKKIDFLSCTNPITP